MRDLVKEEDINTGLNDKHEAGEMRQQLETLAVQKRAMHLPATLGVSLAKGEQMLGLNLWRQKRGPQYTNKLRWLARWILALLAVKPAIEKALVSTTAECPEKKLSLRKGEATLREDRSGSQM